MTTSQYANIILGMDDTETLVALSRMIRETEAKIAAKLAAEQTGECYDGQDLPDPLSLPWRLRAEPL